MEDWGYLLFGLGYVFALDLLWKIKDHLQEIRAITHINAKLLEQIRDIKGEEKDV